MSWQRLFTAILLLWLGLVSFLIPLTIKLTTGHFEIYGIAAVWMLAGAGAVMIAASSVLLIRRA